MKFFKPTRTRIHTGKSKFFESRREAKRDEGFYHNLLKYWIVKEIRSRITVFDCLSYRDVQTIEVLGNRDSTL